MFQNIVNQIQTLNRQPSAVPYNQPATAVVQQGAATAVSFNPLWIVGALAVVIVMVFVFKK